MQARRRIRLMARSLGLALALPLAAFASVAIAAAPAKEIEPRPTASQAGETSAGSRDKAQQADEGQRATPTYIPREPPAEFRGPDITLIASEERMVYEYRQNGQLRMIKVVPKLGKPYYLVPYDRTRGFGDLEQAKTLVAEWVLWEF